MNEHAMRITDSKIIYSNHGYISYNYKSGIFFKIAKFTYELFANESFQYIFEPFYDVLDAFDNLEIPGIDLSLRSKEYIRANLTPVFVSERVPPRNRVNIREVLKDYGLDYYNAFLMLLDSKYIYGGDRLTLKSDKFYDEIIDSIKETNDIYKTITYILRKLGARISMKIGNLEVTDANRTILIKNYLYLYEKVSNYYNKKSEGKRGSEKQTISFLKMKEIKFRLENGYITLEEAIKQSGLGSKSTFYRRLKEYNEMTDD